VSALVALLVILALVVALIAVTKAWVGNGPMCASAALWIAFLVTWSAAAKNAAPAKSAESAASRRLHQNLLNVGLLLLFVRFPGVGWRFLPAAPLLAPLGLGLQAASFLFAVWARRHLGRNWSGEVRVAVDHRLVRSGPYRVVRHPIYSA